jgi:aminopeptidase
VDPQRSSRWEGIAETVVSYSLAVKPGEKVLVVMQETHTFELASAVYRELVKAGAYVQVLFLSDEMRHDLLKYGTDGQAEWIPELESAGMAWADAYLALRGSPVSQAFSDVPAGRIAQGQYTLGKLAAQRWKDTRWTLVRVPHPLTAEQAGLSWEELLEIYFKGSNLDWEREGAVWQRWADQLETGHRVRIVSRGTDLSFSVTGRKWIVFNGACNMPDGEIATAPLTGSVDGYISFEQPAYFGGQKITDLTLRWREGTLIDFSASSSREFLERILSSDEGARNIGEFALGVNYGIDRFCGDILMDEKIGGTVHIALGRAYAECGGVNQSAIHWDIVKDTRSESAVYLDDRIILQDGKILL